MKIIDIIQQQFLFYSISRYSAIETLNLNIEIAIKHSIANASGVSPSTIYSMLNEKSQNPGVVSLKILCDGLDISLREFFDSNLFNDLEQEQL